MSRRNWKTYAEILGIVAIVGSLVFVGLQLRQDRQATESDNLAQNQDTVINVVELINQHRTVWIAGLDGDELTVAEDVTFTMLVEVLFKRNEALYRIGMRLPTSSSERRAQSFAMFVYQHPGLRRKFEERGRLMRQRDLAFGHNDVPRFFQQIVGGYLTELDQANRKFPEKSYVLPGI